MGKRSIGQHLRWLLFSALSGVLAGTSAAIFLLLLEAATSFRVFHPTIIILLPLAGFFIGWIYHRFGRDVGPGTGLILDEIHDPKKTLPLRMAPLVLVGTVITHLFGGSAGREGTAVQMGASLSDQISKFFKVEAKERKILLVAGAGAGFGAAIGAPWASIVFGMEMIYVGRLRFFAVVECFTASFVGYYTAQLLGVHRSFYPQYEYFDVRLMTFFWVAIAAIAFGLATRIFIMATHWIEFTLHRLVAYPPLRPFLGGLLLVAFFYAEASFRYVGLGLPVIHEAMAHLVSFRDPVLKTFFTALTVGSGFKGGEFIPLVFIGATLGSSLALWIPVSFQLLASLGFAAVFGAAANTPIACSLMAMELFGYRIAPYAFLACLLSYYVSGKHGIYKGQKPSPIKVN